MTRPPSRWLLRGLVVALSTTLALLLSDLVLHGLTIAGWPAALGAAALLGVFNVVVWPLLLRLALPISVLTLGLFPIALSAGIVVGVGRVLPGVEFDGLFPAFVATLIISTLSYAATGLLSLNDEDVWANVVLRRGARRQDGRRLVPGVVFVQIDGLGYDVLRRAIRDGNAPTLARWVRTGTHRLSAWETDWSSQTGASQAGILLGSNNDIPAFRWLEKETGTIMVSNRPSCAAEIERRHSRGTGLLRDDGVSRGNLFTGDAPGSVLTLSVVGQTKGRIGSGYRAYFASPYNTSRTFAAFVAEVVRELRQARAQRRLGVRPRVHRGGLYPLLRAFTTVISRDVLTTTIIGDMYDGRSVIYANYVGYDEVSHHAGVERQETLATLLRLDREIGRLGRAAMFAPRPYRIVVLSDHGQSQGPTFLQRYGETLADVAAAGIGGAGQVQAPPGDGDESWGYAGAALTETGERSGLLGRAARRITTKRQVDGEVRLGPDRASRPSAQSALTVLASGNLGLISLNQEPGRVTKERIDALYPRLLETLVNHPGIAFIMVATNAKGPLVMGAEGQIYLETGLVVGKDPLAPFGPRARTKIRRTSSFKHCADIMVNSVWDSQTDEVAAFEELVGSHGGMGGAQSHPFVLHPWDLEMPADVLGAESLHRVLVSWIRPGGKDEGRGSRAARNVFDEELLAGDSGTSAGLSTYLGVDLGPLLPAPRPELPTTPPVGSGDEAVARPSATSPREPSVTPPVTPPVTPRISSLPSGPAPSYETPRPVSVPSPVSGPSPVAGPSPVSGLGSTPSTASEPPAPSAPGRRISTVPPTSPPSTAPPKRAARPALEPDPATPLRPVPDPTPVAYPAPVAPVPGQPEQPALFTPPTSTAGSAPEAPSGTPAAEGPDAPRRKPKLDAASRIGAYLAGSQTTVSDGE